MRTVAMCYSLLQVPRCRIHTFATSYWDSFQNLSRNCGNRYRFSSCSSKVDGIEGGNHIRWSRLSVNTKTEGQNKESVSSKTRSTRNGIYEGTISTSMKLNIQKSESNELERIQYCDIQEKIAEDKELVAPVTVIVFDIETTGFSRQNERIIEIALQDLAGGKNSDFHTLVNPERPVRNKNIHGISTYMVRRSGVPRMKELIPILMKYVKSRQKPGGYVLFAAHNARSFDVPFLTNEFSRCCFEIPPDWLFVDTLPLAREVMKGSECPSKASLQALCQYYGITVDKAHRAMSDVNALSLVLKNITFDLKLPIAGLVEKSFRPSDSIDLKKKKNSS